MKKTLLLLLALVCISSRAADAPNVEIPYDRFVLDNGLRVIVHEDRKAPLVAVTVYYHVGSRDEKIGKTGFAHLFEHLMFNGSENYDDEYFKPFEDVGATGMNGTTWFDRTNYFETVPTPAIEMALWMESDRMGHLLGAITQEKLDNQRGVVQNEKRQGDNQPYGMVEYSELAGLFPEGHPYRWSTIGSMADLDAASLEDVQEWFKTQYGTANVVIALAGDIDVETARPMVEKYFGDIPAGPPLTKLSAFVPEKTSNTRERLQDRVPQARIYRSWTVPGVSSAANAELELASAVLGNGKNSRLYNTLVYEKQLATDASAEVESHELVSIFRITVTVSPGTSVETVNAEIDSIVNEFLDKGLRKGELGRAKTKYEAGFIRGIEEIGGFNGKASVLAEGELYAGDPGFYRTRMIRLNQASDDSVLASARSWLRKGYHQIDVTPFGNYSVSGQDADRSALPVVSTTPDLVFPTIQRATLKNGISVVLAERHTVPVVEFVVQFDAGYAADSGRKLGTAGFTMAMLDEGTKKRSAMQISEQSESLGAIISANSTLDSSYVSLSALKNNLEPSLELFADVVRQPAFSEQEIDRLKPRWVATIQQEKNQPVGIALRVLPPLLYGEQHPYGIPFRGTGNEASINAMTRDDLIAFQNDWLRADNATIFVVGDTTLDEVLPRLEKHFGNWKAPASPRPDNAVAKVPVSGQSRVFLVNKPGSPQSMILAGRLAPPTGVKNNIAIETMNNALGGQFSARMNMNLREDKGWAYGAYTFLREARHQRPFMVYAPVQTDRTADSMQEIVKEIQDFLGDKPPTADELDRNVKNSVRSLPGQYETAQAVLDTLRSNAEFARPDDYASKLKQEYESLTVEQLELAAGQVLEPQGLTWVVIGDVEKIKDQITELGLGEVTIMDLD